MLYLEHLLKLPAMLRNILSGKAMCLGEKDDPAYLILLQMKRQLHHRTCFLPTIRRVKRKETTHCLLLLLWMKNVNQWILPTPMMESRPLQSRKTHSPVSQ